MSARKVLIPWCASPSLSPANVTGVLKSALAKKLPQGLDSADGQIDSVGHRKTLRADCLKGGAS